MLKKALLAAVLLTGMWACMSTSSLTPTLQITTLSPSAVSELSLEDRIILEEAWVQVKRGDGRRAEKLFMRLGEQNLFYNAGMGYAAMLNGDPTAAEAWFKHALAQKQDMAITYLGLAQLYLLTGREEPAFNAFLEVQKREPDNAWVLEETEALRQKKTEQFLTEAKINEEAGALEKSKEAYLKALHFTPKSLEAHLSLARLYKNQGLVQNSLFHLEAATSIEPKDRDILRDYAETLSQAEHYGKSLDAYERLAELDPRNKDIRTRIESLKNRLGIFELPSQYEAIETSPTVTREETAALIAVMFKDFLDEGSAKPPVIIDISTSWASRFILKTATLKVMDVYSNHTFQPKQPVNRAEMAAILVRLVGIFRGKGYRFIHQFPPEMIRITDISPDNFYFQTIADVVSLQLMELFPDKTFRPELTLSGKEALRIFDLMLALLK